MADVTETASAVVAVALTVGTADVTKVVAAPDDVACTDEVETCSDVGGTVPEHPMPGTAMSCA